MLSSICPIFSTGRESSRAAATAPAGGAEELLEAAAAAVVVVPVRDIEKNRVKKNELNREWKTKTVMTVLKTQLGTKQTGTELFVLRSLSEVNSTDLTK